jgi:5'-nucleotidase
MLQPYERALDNAVDLDILVGYSPSGSRRFSTSGGDSPLGNVVGNAIWLRLGIQTDFSMTNSTGVRADLNPGPVTIEQMYNIFPFDNSIAKMQLTGKEVQELFDFAARRSARRGCSSQIQIAGARVRMNCTGCDRTKVTCESDGDCTRPEVNRDACESGFCVVRCQSDEQCHLKLPSSICNLERGTCEIDSCAEQVYIGNIRKEGKLVSCTTDAECSPDPDRPLPESCSKQEGAETGVCLSLIATANKYELATSNYLAGGGSGFRVLQRNTTQFDTKIQQRDALVDYLRAGRPCLWNAKENGTPDGLPACSTDADCGSPEQVCSCPGHVAENRSTPVLRCESQGSCDRSVGRCVLKACRDQVAQFHVSRCAGVPDLATCQNQVGACQLGGESCKILTCIDSAIGSLTDNRIRMIGR